jgi:hypothetical protein
MTHPLSCDSDDRSRPGKKERDQSDHQRKDK